MPFFQILTYLAPLLAGLGVGAALALTEGRPPLRRALAAGAVLVALLLLLLAAAAAGFMRFYLPSALLVATFSVLVAGLYLFCESLRMPREAAQIVTGLAVTLLMGTIYVFGPGIIAAAEDGTPFDITFRRISLALQVNPFAVAAYGIFDISLLNTDAFYTTIKLAEYQHDPPRLGPAILGYVVAGLAFFGLSRGVAAARRKPT